MEKTPADFDAMFIELVQAMSKPAESNVTFFTPLI